MAGFTLTRHIERPTNEVFSLFTNLDEMPRLIDKIVSIEVLTEGPPAKKTGKQATGEMEITDFQADESYTLFAEGIDVLKKAAERAGP